MTVQQLREKIPVYQQNPIFSHDGDFCAVGLSSPQENARTIIRPIQQACRELHTPVIYADFPAFVYLQTGELVDGFLTNSPDFVHVGNLSVRRTPVQYTRAEECKYCGSGLPPVSGKCVKCGNAHVMNYVANTIPIYATTTPIIPRSGTYDYTGHLFITDGDKGVQLDIHNIP